MQNDERAALGPNMTLTGPGSKSYFLLENLYVMVQFYGAAIKFILRL